MRLLLAISAAALALVSACNECSFEEECEGNVRQICGSGVDQQIGREVRSIPCSSPNSACVRADEDVTACVAPPAQECDPSAFEAECDGDLALSCVAPQGEFMSSAVSWIVAQDCAAEGLACEIRAGDALCG
jgi:hypothetical protein